MLIVDALVLAAVQITLVIFEYAQKQPLLYTSIVWASVSSLILLLEYGIVGFFICLVLNVVIASLMIWRVRLNKAP